MDKIEIKTRLMKLNRSQKYLAMVFRKPESHISLAIKGDQYLDLKEKIIKHIELLESKQEANQ